MDWVHEEEKAAEFVEAERTHPTGTYWEIAPTAEHPVVYVCMLMRLLRNPRGVLCARLAITSSHNPGVAAVVGGEHTEREVPLSELKPVKPSRY